MKRSVCPTVPSITSWRGVAGAAIATSPAMMACVTTETGVVTMIIMVLLAGYLLTRRAADFARAEPKSPGPTTDQRTAVQRARPDDLARCRDRALSADRVGRQGTVGQAHSVGLNDRVVSHWVMSGWSSGSFR
jgi:hypothetical protein